jgi:hypothetical protein
MAALIDPISLRERSLIVTLAHFGHEQTGTGRGCI